MQPAATNHPLSLSLNKYVLPVIMLIVVLFAGFFAFRELNIRATNPALSGVTTISAAVLEEKYGLRVNLIAVTAAGGMVDLRLKMVDSAKAKTLLQDKESFPALVVTDSDVILVVSAETQAQEIQAQEIQFENGSSLYLLFPNARGVVKPGSLIAVKFGDLLLESLISK